MKSPESNTQHPTSNTYAPQGDNSMGLGSVVIHRLVPSTAHRIPLQWLDTKNSPPTFPSRSSALLTVGIFPSLHLGLQVPIYPMGHVMTYTLHKRRLAPWPARPIQYKTCLIPMSTWPCFRSSPLACSLLSNPCLENLLHEYQPDALLCIEFLRLG